MTSKAQQGTGYGWARRELELRIDRINQELDMIHKRITEAKRGLSADEECLKDKIELREGYMQILKLTPNPHPSVAS